jgi:hypothetical protein
MEKISPKLWPTSVFFEKLSKVNDSLICSPCLYVSKKSRLDIKTGNSNTKLKLSLKNINVIVDD